MSSVDERGSGWYLFIYMFRNHAPVGDFLQQMRVVNLEILLRSQQAIRNGRVSWRIGWAEIIGRNWLGQELFNIWNAWRGGVGYTSVTWYRGWRCLLMNRRVECILSRFSSHTQRTCRLGWTLGNFGCRGDAIVFGSLKVDAQRKLIGRWWLFQFIAGS